MFTPDFHIKRHDTYPSIAVRIRNKKTKQYLDLTGASATFTMLDSEGALKVSTAVANVPAPQTDGRISYDWIAANTDTAGRFRGEFEITLASGKKFSAPQQGFLEIFVEEDGNDL